MAAAQRRVRLLVLCALRQRHLPRAAAAAARGLCVPGEAGQGRGRPGPRQAMPGEEREGIWGAEPEPGCLHGAHSARTPTPDTTTHAPCARTHTQAHSHSHLGRSPTRAPAPPPWSSALADQRVACRQGQPVGLGAADRGLGRGLWGRPGAHRLLIPHLRAAGDGRPGWWLPAALVLWWVWRGGDDWLRFGVAAMRGGQAIWGSSSTSSGLAGRR